MKNEMENIYGTPSKRAEDLVIDTIYYGYEGDFSKIESAKNCVLMNVSEILRNCTDHNKSVEKEYYEKVKTEVETYNVVR